MEKLKFISYCRVSTAKQWASGLSISAQRTIVSHYISSREGILIKEFCDTETGSNDVRKGLLEAIEATKVNNATLIIAKLDRLSRNLTFISTLMDSKVKFICCDMPDATELTISIFASLAQWERKRISERTKEALAAKKVREPNWEPDLKNLTVEGRTKGRNIIAANAKNNKAWRHAYWFIKPLKELGETYKSISTKLNDEGYRTRGGSMFHPAQVRVVWERFQTKSNV